jgi:hypothetical protein
MPMPKRVLFSSRNIRRRLPIFALLLFCAGVFCKPGPCFALTQHGDYYIKLSAGGFFPLFDDDNPTLQVANGLWTEGEFGVVLTKALEVCLQAGWTRSGVHVKGLRLGHLDTIPAALAVRYRLFPRDNIVPFLFAGAGYSFNYGTKDNVDFDATDGWLWRAGLGTDFFLTPSWVIRVEGKYQGTRAELSSGTVRHTVNLGSFVATIGFAWYW